ncbi:MAG: fibronectin type III domain-containing protein, partial [Candidatus Doudnabacteria bacterium]|nr:fibronectin type III domain-containing protein [Candidatus Doudnabacteria bacterium]
WQTNNATTLTIDQGIGTVTGTTSKTVTPTASTTYTLTATGSVGSVTKSVTVSVSDIVPPPPVEVTTAPVLTAVRAQSVGATSVVIAWTTDQASSSVVDYGTTTRFGSTQVGAGGVTEHAVTLNNLRAGKRYYFRVRSSVGEKEAISARGSFVTGLVSTNPAPTGSFDGVNAGAATVFGWAQDNSDPTKPVTVHMYFDNNAGTSGAAPVSCVAGDTRSDVGNHAFNCPIPSTYIDGTSHQVWVWALDLSDGSKNVQLSGSPQSFVLGTQTPLPPPPPATLPTISSFTATPTTVTSGTAVTLAWQTNNATTLTIDQGIGTVTGTTSKTATPTASTTYTLTATGSAGSVTKSVTVGVSAPVLVRDGYGDTLSATQFYGWFTSPDDSIANVVYEQIATGQQYTQQATRSIARTDAATWLQQTYGASVSVVQPLGFSVNPSAVISAPGTYRIKSVTLLTSGTSISLSSAASGTFTIATTTPPTTSTGSVAGIAETSGMTGAVYAPPTSGAYAYSPPGGFSPDKSGFLSVGQSYIDPVFGSKITRLSADYPNGGSGVIYGRNGFWNADGTKYIHEFSSGKKIIDAKTGSVVYSGVPGMVSDATFDPVDPDVYYYSEYNGTKLLQLRVSTGTVTTVKDFGTTVGSLGGTGNNIDVSGRYFVLNIGGSLRVYDKVNAVLYAGSTPADFGDGYVAMATDGSGFAVIGGTVKRWHAIDHAAKTVSASGFTFLNQGGDHGTLMTGTDGQTYFVKPSGDDGNIHAYNVRTGANKTLVKMVDSTSLGWCDDTHYSAIARGPLRDWVLVDTEIYSATGGCANADALSAVNPTSSWWKYRQEIFMVNVLTGEVRRLAHHRGRNLSNYCATPRINVNWDGTAAMFASNFGALGSSSCGYSDLYRVDLYK